MTPASEEDTNDKVTGLRTSTQATPTQNPHEAL